MLLVLDNFEHLLDAVGDLAHLLERCPGFLLLVKPDHIREPAAVMLFEQRARAVDPAFALTAGNARAVAETCTRLDGLPLAIELAAAIRTFEPGELSRRLENRLDFLEDSPRDMPGRQRTLRGAIGWSHGLLDAPTRTVFRHLAVFQGSFTLEAAVAVVSDARTRDAVPDALQSLLVGNLLARTPDLGGEVPSEFRPRSS